eukprot:scaffold1410_cov242-Pinguiococcus_pyrenoidosus.AAC.11
MAWPEPSIRTADTLVACACAVPLLKQLSSLSAILRNVESWLPVMKSRSFGLDGARLDCPSAVC